MYWFKEKNKYELMVETPEGYEASFATVYYDVEEQTWAWVDTMNECGYYGFETAEEAQIDCEICLKLHDYEGDFE